jgi:putative sugar O-methyltransferase
MIARVQNSLTQKLLIAVNNPIWATRYLKRRLISIVGPKQFVGIPGNRSESDNGDYVAFVERATRNSKVFSRFRLHSSYRLILEHVSKGDGEKYLQIIQTQTPEFAQQITKFKINDLVGSPVTHSYPVIGSINPTTLRYIKVASDLKKLFLGNIGSKIIEIGVGYGGQCLVIDQAFSVKEYHLYDLQPVLNLVSKYLESYTLNSSYKVFTINQNAGTENYDLVISNYAFSELPASLQRKYIEKILSKSERGYLTMNSGLESSSFSLEGKLSLNDLRTLLPPFEVLEESPITAPNNYIIVWGHK